MNRQVIQWLEVLLEERFGHSFTIASSDQGLDLFLSPYPGAITFTKFFPALTESRSDIPCCEWSPTSEGFHTAISSRLPAPGTVSLQVPLVEQTNDKHLIHYDILGLVYWMLNRVEEIGRSDLDSHGRFPATASHAFRFGYLERPIVDEWLDILKQVIKRQWPDIRLREHQFAMKISHDVDAPSRYGFQSIKGLIRTIGGDIVKRKDIKSAFLAPWLWLSQRRTIHPLDPFNTFEWIMDQSEKNDLISAFYFICGRTDPHRDAQYEPEHSAIRALIRSIRERGHEIGLHPSYNTYQTPSAVVYEAKRLRKVCEEEGVQQTFWGGRMHFLRWEHPTTLNAWEAARMSYDSTLGYADHPGFRCGTCFEYPAFDPVAKRLLALRIRPLIAMDCSVISERYLGLKSTEAAYERFNQLKERCKAVNGQFTLLWHNSFFYNQEDFTIYSRLVSR